MANQTRGRKPRKPRAAKPPAPAAEEQVGEAKATPANLSTSTLALALEILSRQQVNVGAADFETAAVRAIQARQELRAALEERGVEVSFGAE